MWDLSSWTRDRAGEGQSLNHWATREVPYNCTFLTTIFQPPHNLDNFVLETSYAIPSSCLFIPQTVY